MRHEPTVPRHPVRESVQDAILDLVIHVPASREKRAAHPAVRAKTIARQAARQASFTAGSLALPPGGAP